VIIAVCAWMVNERIADQSPSGPNPDDSLGVLLMGIQAKYIVGAAHVMAEQRSVVYTQARTSLNTGSLDQRMRFVVLAGELSDDAAAAEALGELDQAIEGERSTQSTQPDHFELTNKQQRVLETLHTLYGDAGQQGAASRADRIAALTSAQRDEVLKDLGWFGKIALGTPEGTGDSMLHAQAVQSALKVFYVIIAALAAGAFAGLIGLGIGITLIVLAAQGKLQHRFKYSGSHHGVYAETFALWLAGYTGLSLAGSLLPEYLHMPYVAIIFFGGLAAVLWPVIRGIPWSIVRQDIGWTLGRNPAAEVGSGIAGYFVALPLLAIGVALTFVLLQIQMFLQPHVQGFAPSSGPAHPIIEQLGGPNIWPKVLVLVLAAIGAPLVEETMFRGVLFRHLREATRGCGWIFSFLLSATINAFVFAAIHPQGWVAIPALMSLAYAFLIMREWRNSLLPCMIIHGTSNGIVMMLVIVLLGA
jgi:membrane protease YdiL (CAAX protease family)